MEDLRRPDVTLPETFTFERAGSIPNSRLPVLVYRGVEAARSPSQCMDLFARNGWRGGWVNRIWPFHRFHSNAHEVLGIVDGSGAITLGGPEGRRVPVARGDVLVLPAGTGHSNAGSGTDLVVVGAYPDGMDWDMWQDDPGEFDHVLANIAAVPVPDSDPVEGGSGPLTELWLPGSPGGAP